MLLNEFSMRVSRIFVPKLIPTVNKVAHKVRQKQTEKKHIGQKLRKTQGIQGRKGGLSTPMFSLGLSFQIGFQPGGEGGTEQHEKTRETQPDTAEFQNKIMKMHLTGLFGPSKEVIGG